VENQNLGLIFYIIKRSWFLGHRGNSQHYWKLELKSLTNYEMKFSQWRFAVALKWSLTLGKAKMNTVKSWLGSVWTNDKSSRKKRNTQKTWRTTRDTPTRYRVSRLKSQVNGLSSTSGSGLMEAKIFRFLGKIDPKQVSGNFDSPMANCKDQLTNSIYFTFLPVVKHTGIK